jgi:PAS domain S-box-containing protein
MMSEKLQQSREAIERSKVDWVGSAVAPGAAGELVRARLATIVETSSDAIFCKTPEGIITTWNAGAARMFGYTEDEMIGTPITILMPPDRINEPFEIIERLKSGHLIQQMETERVHKDGHTLHVSLTISPIQDREGNLVTASVIARDITEQKMIERALRESEERLRAALAASATGTFRWDFDTGAVYWDENLYRLFGLKDTQLVENIDQFLALVHPDDREAVSAATEAARRAGQEFELAFRVIWGDGTIHWILDKGKVVSGADGQPAYTTGACVDITQRKLAEKALEESEARFRGTFEEAAVGLAHVDHDGHWIRMNQRLCDILGYTRRELAAMTFQDLTHPADLDMEWRQFSALMSGAINSYRIEKRYRRKNKGIVWVHLTASAQRDEEGRPLYAIHVMEDITARKEAEKALQEVNETLERRVAERTASLVHYQGQLRGLASELTVTAETERRRIATELHDFLAQQLVVCQLKLAQLKRHAKAPKADTLAKELDELLADSLRYTRSLIAELSPSILYEAGLVPALRWLAGHMKQHTLTVEVEERDEIGKLPEDQAILIFQAVRELLFNVVKHAQVDSAEVIVSLHNHRLHVLVRDNGKGFDPAAQQQAPAVGGRFGLFSIRERLEAMGGEFVVRSVPGNGTECALRLPVRLAPRKPAPAIAVTGDPARTQPRSDKRGSGNRITVLLTDDHTMVREGLRRVLDGYNTIDVVGEAADGLQALELTQILQPDVILMDINMPRLNGIDAIKHIRATFPSVSIIALSVQDDQETMDRAMEAGADVYLTKGGPTDQLYQAIKSVHKQRTHQE